MLLSKHYKQKAKIAKQTNTLKSRIRYKYFLLKKVKHYLNIIYLQDKT